MIHLTTMIRVTTIAFAILCVLALRMPAAAMDMGVAAAPAPTPDAARLMALEIAARAQGGNSRGIFTPSAPPVMARTPAPPIMAASGSTLPATPSATCGNQTAAPGQNAADGGMRFMPLQRAQAAREFPVPSRGQIVTRAESLRAAVAGSKSESALAQAALEAANAPSPQQQAIAELAHASAASPSGGAVAPSSDPSTAAHEAVLHEIQRYRNGHGLY